MLVDTNRLNIERAKELGLEAINGNIYSDDLTDNIELNDVGYLLAMTGNDEINKQAILRYGSVFGENGSFRLMNTEERKVKNTLSSTELFSTTHDYVRFTEVARDFPSIQELPIETQSKFMKLLGYIEEEENAVALFVKNDEIPCFRSQIQFVVPIFIFLVDNLRKLIRYYDFWSIISEN